MRASWADRSQKIVPWTVVRKQAADGSGGGVELRIEANLLRLCYHCHPFRGRGMDTCGEDGLLR
jgi:hypothetical protein